MLRQFELYLDALIIDCSIAGACTLVTEITRAHPDVQVIVIVSDSNSCENCVDLLKARFRGPEDRAPRAASELRRCHPIARNRTTTPYPVDRWSLIERFVNLVMDALFR